MAYFLEQFSKLDLKTWPFALFFVAFFAIYLISRRTKLWPHWILIGSYVFYGLWNWWYLALIAYATSVDYVVVRRMDKKGKSKVWLAIGILNNIAILGFFKYCRFFLTNLNAVLDKMGTAFQVTIPEKALAIGAVGMSFYIFKSIGYLVDYYRGDIDREPNYVRYAAFVSFFPLLINGPIERGKNLLPQLNKKPALTVTKFTDGLSIFLVGMFKNVALAAPLKIYADKIYDLPDFFSAAHLIMGTFAFGWWLYFSFSGYSDMARGVSKMLGFEIMINFNNPYLATGVSDFWRRWHISLSTWFRDYLYIPLGGSRVGKLHIYFNLFAVMLVSGLWHGAAWTFIIWGAIHGLAMSLLRGLERRSFYKEKYPKILKQLTTFIIVMFAWIFFRAESLEVAKTIVTRVFTAGFENPEFPIWILFLIMAVWVYEFAYESKLRGFLRNPFVKISIASFMILYLCLCASIPKVFVYN